MLEFIAEFAPWAINTLCEMTEFALFFSVWTFFILGGFCWILSRARQEKIEAKSLKNHETQVKTGGVKKWKKAG